MNSNTNILAGLNALSAKMMKIKSEEQSREHMIKQLTPQSRALLSFMTKRPFP